MQREAQRERTREAAATVPLSAVAVPLSARPWLCASTRAPGNSNVLSNSLAFNFPGLDVSHQLQGLPPGWRSAAAASAAAGEEGGDGGEEGAAVAARRQLEVAAVSGMELLHALAGTSKGGREQAWAE